MTSEADTFDRLLKARFSCRGFLPDALPRDVIDAALAQAQQVASWCNSQPWQVIALSQPETVDFADALYEHVANAPHESDIEFPARYEGGLQGAAQHLRLAAIRCRGGAEGGSR